MANELLQISATDHVAPRLVNPAVLIPIQVTMSTTVGYAPATTRQVATIRAEVDVTVIRTM
jgi:hypothetical protein